MIARSSQPLIGPKQKRSIEDEQYILSLLYNNSTNNTNVMPCIIEARTKANAALAKSKGGGYEADGSYPRIRMFFTTLDSPSYLKDQYLKYTEGNTICLS